MSTTAALSTSALSQQPVATAVPAPIGFGASVSAALVTAAANTTVALKSGTSNPSNVPALGFVAAAAGAAPMGKVRPMAAGQYNPAYYTVMTPAAAITVAGTVSYTQQFPAGVLAVGTAYYLGFYDSTQSSPAWQTIAGPVTATTSNSLTFSGTIGSFTLQQNATYGFCIFSVSGSATPPPQQSQDEAYLAQNTSGIVIVNTAGTVVNTLKIDSDSLGLDDGGNIYNEYSPSVAPSATAAPPIIQKYASGTTTPSTTYVSAIPAGQAGIYEMIVESSGSGEVVNFWENFNTTPYTLSAEVWPAGSSGGPPSYTLTERFYATPAFDVQHDGTIYLANNTGTTAGIDVYAPGSSTPTRTVPETIVTGSNLQNFDPNYLTVGPDGTIYLTEYSYLQPDALAGLYIYPPSKPEKFVATTSDANGPGPQGVDIDVAGNIYVANNNAAVYNSSTGANPQTDDLHDIEVFAPGGTSVLRHITGSFDPYPLVVAPDGTAFFASYPGYFGGGLTAAGVMGTFVIPPGGSAATEVTSDGETTIVLYNGYQESTTSVRRKSSSYSAGAAAAHAGPAAFERFIHYAHRNLAR